MSLNQFSKLPLLVGHFVNHWERNHDIGFGTFLDMHYFGNDINDDDDSKDKELPFKNFSPNSIQVFTVPGNEINFVIHPKFELPVAEPFAAGDQFYCSKVLHSLFRPPRILA